MNTTVGYFPVKLTYENHIPKIALSSLSRL